MSRNNAAAAVLECRELELKLREMQQPSGHKGEKLSKSSSKSSSIPSSNPVIPTNPNQHGPSASSSHPLSDSSNASGAALPTGSKPGSGVSSRSSPTGDGGNVPTSNKTTSSPGLLPNQPPHQTAQLLHEVELEEGEGVAKEDGQDSGQWYGAFEGVTTSIRLGLHEVRGLRRASPNTDSESGSLNAAAPLDAAARARVRGPAVLALARVR